MCMGPLPVARNFPTCPRPSVLDLSRSRERATLPPACFLNVELGLELAGRTLEQAPARLHPSRPWDAGDT